MTGANFKKESKTSARRRHYDAERLINSVKADIIHISYIGLCTANIHTHVEWAWSVDAWPTDQLVSLASRPGCAASPWTLTTTQWMLASQNFLTYRTCMDRGHHQSESHWHRASETLSSAPTPTSLLADHSASTATTSLGLYKPFTRHFTGGFILFVLIFCNINIITSVH